MDNSAWIRNLKIRDRVIRSIRDFFHSEGFVEVATPLIVQAPLPEPSIDTFQVCTGPNNPPLYLIPSPELHLKRLLARGLDKVFQLGPAFRKGERGAHHLPEFTMLEWYRVGADYNCLMEDCECLIAHSARAVGIKGQSISYDGNSIDISRPFPRITVDEAFKRWAGWSPLDVTDPDRFDEDMAFKVEPALPISRPCFLLDYPATFASLARLKPGVPGVAERVEFYAGGLELANGFSELTDVDEQEVRFQRDRDLRRKRGLEDYPWPGAFLSDLKRLPPCAGMAMGVDRLVMLLAGSKNIDEVIPLPPECN